MSLGHERAHDDLSKSSFTVAMCLEFQLHADQLIVGEDQLWQIKRAVHRGCV